MNLDAQGGMLGQPCGRLNSCSMLKEMLNKPISSWRQRGTVVIPGQLHYMPIALYSIPTKCTLSTCKICFQGLVSFLFYKCSCGQCSNYVATSSILFLSLWRHVRIQSHGDDLSHLKLDETWWNCKLTVILRDDLHLKPACWRKMLKNRPILGLSWPSPLNTT